VRRNGNATVIAKLDFQTGQFGQRRKLVGDPKSPGNKPSDEGHGFSRAVNSPAQAALAAEVTRFPSFRGKLISFAKK
jgi:hypothetical protein